MGSSSGGGFLGSITKPVTKVGGAALKSVAAPLESKFVKNVALPVAAVAGGGALGFSAGGALEAMGGVMAGTSVAGMATGAQAQRKAAKGMGELLAAMHQPASAQTAKIETHSKKLAFQQDNEQKKLNKGIARAGRRRIKGGLFGDTESTPGILSLRLG